MRRYGRPGRLVRWLLVGPAAVTGLVGVLAGGPALLLTLGGNPLPDRFPTPGYLFDLLTRPDDGQLLLWTLSVVGWMAWAVAAGSLLLELGAQLTGRRTPQVPGLAGPQRLASVLVAGVLAALTTPGISPAHAAYLDHPAPVVAPAPLEAAAQPSEQLVHEVDRGDWMWHIAGRYLGDEQRYPEIAALNPGYAQRYPDYPDHIQPGDRLVLPADAQDSGERRHATGEPAGEVTEPEPARPPSGSGAGEPTPPPIPTPAENGNGNPGSTPPPGAVPSPPGAGAGPPQEAAPAPGPPVDAPVGEGASAQPAAGPLLTAGVLASVLVGALGLYRWRKAARRRAGRVITHPGDAAVEATLRAAATADVARLDRALRWLSGSLTGRLPDVGAVWIGDGEIHLILATPAEHDPPLPFHASGPSSWFLPATAALPEVTGVLAPLPALVTIGSQPGQHLLVDLERMGMLTVTGNPDRTGDLLRYLVAELAHNPWSDQVRVVLAGFSPEVAEVLVALNPDRVSVAASLSEAAGDLRRRLSHTTSALAGHGLADSVHGRTSDTATDTWAPHLLIVNRPRPEHDELLGYLEGALVDAGRRCAVAVATAAPATVGYGRRSIAITDEGLLKAGFLDDSHPLPAVALPEHLLGPLADLLQHAAAETDYPAPPATEPTPRPEPAPSPSPAPVPTPALGPEPAPDPEPDPGLDDDLARWWRDAAQPPRVALLGPVQLTAPGPPPSHRARVCQEMVVYLTARGDRGADADEISRRLWPTQQVSPTLRTDVIMNVRRWLGTGPDGAPWLSEATTDGRYRVREGLLVDWQLFGRLRARGERRGPAGAADLRAALSLVDGPPLQDAGELAGASSRVPYSWLPGSPIQPELILAGVVDAAHLLVELSLAAGDHATARWAVRQAWLADSRRSDDHPWRDLLRIAQAGGDQAEVRDVVAELLGWRDAEHPDELAPATRQLVRSLLSPPTPAGRPA